MGKKRATTAAGQIQTMQSLSQSAAAWLLGVAARTLRDKPTMPRNSDGTYDAKDLLGWARGRIERVDLPDAEHERCLLAVAAGQWEPSAGAVLAVLDDLQDTHGDGGLLAFVDVLRGELQGIVAAFPEDYGDPVDVLVKRRLDSDQAAHRRELHGADRLESVVVCEKCSKVRSGRKWVKQTVTAGKAVVSGRCPGCRG